MMTIRKLSVIGFIDFTLTEASDTQVSRTTRSLKVKNCCIRQYTRQSVKRGCFLFNPWFENNNLHIDKKWSFPRQIQTG